MSEQYNYPIGPTEGGAPLSGGFGNQLADLFKNRGFLNLLAGIGKGLDPQGVGGALGGATIAYNQSQAASERADKQQMKYDEWVSKLIANHGGITPKGTEGITNMTATPTGVKMEIDSPSHVQTPESTLSTTQPVVPTTPTTPTAPTVAPSATSTSMEVPTNASGAQTQNANIRSLLPFWQALLA